MDEWSLRADTVSNPITHRRGPARHNIAANRAGGRSTRGIDGPKAITMKLFARDALLPSGWAHDVLIDVAGDGTIGAVDVAFDPSNTRSSARLRG